MHSVKLFPFFLDLDFDNEQKSVEDIVYLARLVTWSVGYALRDTAAVPVGGEEVLSRVSPCGTVLYDCGVGASCSCQHQQHQQLLKVFHLLLVSVLITCKAARSLPASR